VRRRILAIATIATLVLGAVGIANALMPDFGTQRDEELLSQSLTRFGVKSDVPASSTASITQAQAVADPTKLVTLAKGLTAHVVTDQAAPNLDMMVLWPSAVDPQYLIMCNEQEGATDPGLQRINVTTGAAETIVTGTIDCDPVEATPWGTVVFGEEAGGGPNGGRVYELLDPVGTTGVSLDRTTGVFSGGTGASNLTARPALGRLSFEGIGILPNGVTYYGDENRPASGTAGGAYFKFVPAHPFGPSSGPITDLADSPFAGGGSIFGLRLGKRSGNTDFGQGTEFGQGVWVPVPSAADPDLRAQAAALKLTGYYRPEDLDLDPVAIAAGKVKWCANNTGNESQDHLWGEMICLTDGSIAAATANTATPEVQPLVLGTPELAMMDNIAYQPGTGNWVLHEDGDGAELTPPRNNDLWDCLPDGADADQQSDGCLRIATLNDLTAEWTGGAFDATGTHLFVSVQHNISGQGVILDITGWK
jgi:secreted PhoX family phosphatase